ncbi:MAG: hypothetical protein CMO16_01275 [Thaumarchaeota archaeon]|nr:hypothetical protein [Nitrososphaerota archaeon]|tara:strand:+ start:2795 stop:3286 length:492 start_codon:yes stop_codon:yes gene_type:complete
MSSVCFIADGMLGSLARKLRIFGFDTLYYNDVEDFKLIEIGEQQERILLTCDKILIQRAMNAGISSVLLDGSGDVDDMIHILRNYKINFVEFLPENSRCPICNNILDRCDKNSINKLIPEKIFNIHERFYLCKQCNKVYWEGSHLKKLREFGLFVKRGLNDTS